MKKIHAEEGYNGFYKGWRASVLRELTYSGMRVGLYEPCKEALGSHDNRNTPLCVKIFAGIISGAIGASVCTPYDLMKVRFQAAATAEAYNKLGTPHGELLRIFRSEGIRGLYRGVLPTTIRGALITCSQVPSYDHIKHTFLNHQWMSEGRPLHFLASIGAGAICVAVVNPTDVVKTRIMVSTGRPKGLLATGFEVVQGEGVLSLYKGAFSAWLRLAPHTVVTFMTLEYVRSLFNIRPI
eukprot:PhF_6_TR38865/c0_g1_i1/m.58122